MKKFFLLAVVAVLVSVTGCSGLHKSPKHIFFISLDTTRGDAVDFSLKNNSKTPNLAALAAEGQAFRNAYTLIPITLPSHFSMFYSLPPHMLKIYNNGQIGNVKHPSLTQLLHNKGYKTGAVVSLGVLKKDFGLHKGFDYYGDTFPRNMWYRNAAQVNEDAFQAIEKFRDQKSFFWIHYSDPHEPYYPPGYRGDFTVEANKKILFRCRSIDQPQVDIDLKLEPGLTKVKFSTEIPREFGSAEPVRVHFMTYQNFSLAPVGPENKDKLAVALPKSWKKADLKHKVNYFAPGSRSRLVLENRSRKPLNVKLSFTFRMLETPKSRPYLYGRQVQYMDDQIGRLIDFLKKKGMYKDSLFVITGDHGEGLGEYRNHYGHIHYLNKIYTHIPVIVAGVGVKRKGLRDEPVSCLDMAPTILDAAGLKIPEFMQGKSLLKKLGKRKIVLETYSPEAYFDAFSIVDYPWQIVYYPGRKDEKIEFINLKKDRYGTVNLMDSAGHSREKTDLYNQIVKIGRVMIGAKGKIGKMENRHKQILKSLGYL